MFFDALNIKTITSEGFSDAVNTGKHIARAEFCAPMASLHGHVRYLMEKSDRIFLPVYLEKKDRDARRQYCYYSQYASSLASLSADPKYKNKFSMPLVNYIYTDFYTKISLYQMMRTFPFRNYAFTEVSSAYDKAQHFKQACRLELNKIYIKESDTSGDIHVVLLGRPYTVLDENMNKKIPDIFASMGIKVFFQDMIDYRDLELTPPLTKKTPWRYASEILESAETVARTPGAYPVYVTSFMCTPDSFAVEYYKNLMEAYDKPYLILQLDEHDSNVGYETRIEAAVRAFKNHFIPKAVLDPVKTKPSKSTIVPNVKKWRDDKNAAYSQLG